MRCETFFKLHHLHDVTIETDELLVRVSIKEVAYRLLISYALS